MILSPTSALLYEASEVPTPKSRTLDSFASELQCFISTYVRIRVYMQQL